MTVGDILKVIDGAPLSAFPWGIRLVALINAFLDPHLHVSLSDTGETLCQRVDTLSPDIRNYLLTRSLNTRPGDPTVPPPIPTPVPSGDVVHEDAGFIPNWRTTVVGIFGLCFILICGKVALDEHVRIAHAQGVDQQSGLFTRVVKAMFDQISQYADNADEDKTASKALSGTMHGNEGKDSHQGEKPPQ